MIGNHTPLALRPSPYADTAVPPVAAPPLDQTAVSVRDHRWRLCRTFDRAASFEQGPTHRLEAQEPGWGASGNNGGQLNPGSARSDTIEATFGAELASA